MVLLAVAAVSALLTIALFAAARHAWRAASSMRRRPGPDAGAALRRHPASRGQHASLVPGDPAGPLSAQWPAPTGPDDDPEFIDALERLIRGDGDGPGR
jgi:hypothetical protein